MRPSPKPTPILRDTRAETLAEVIIAFIVFGIVATAAISFMVRGLDTNQEIKDRLIAYNFARESVEAVRNLRDTNWLRFPGNRTECWNVMLDTTSSIDCTPTISTYIGGDASTGGVDYIIYPETADARRLFSWNFVEVDPTATDTLTIYETDIGSAMTPLPLYTQDTACAASGSACTPTKYRRYVNIVSTDTDTVSDGYADILIITTTVSWESDGIPRTVTFMDKLRNY